MVEKGPCYLQDKYHSYGFGQQNDLLAMLEPWIVKVVAAAALRRFGVCDLEATIDNPQHLLLHHLSCSIQQQEKQANLLSQL